MALRAARMKGRLRGSRDAIGDGEPGADDAFGQSVQLRITARPHHPPSVRREAPSVFSIPTPSDAASIRKFLCIA
jgi:hypothetical protein